MTETGQFNINSITKPTNKDVTVIFTPSKSVTSYSYYVYQNDKIINTIDINNNESSNIYLEDTGTYKITITAHLTNGKTQTMTSGYYIIDKEKPELILSSTNIEITPNKSINVTATAHDNYDGNLTSKITSNKNKINFANSGNYKLTYTVSDEAGNRTVQSVNVNVVKPGEDILMIQFLSIAAIVILLLWIYKMSKILRLEKRIDPFTVKPLKSNELSILDKLANFYKSIIKLISQKLQKLTFSQKYAKKLEKYVVVTPLHQTGMDILSGKILIGILLVLIAIITKAFQLKALGFTEALLIFIIGFFIMDFYAFIKYKLFRLHLENDFIAAITIMNNTFKAGRSISQAINTVSEQMKGTMAEEFKRMNLELLYGLSIETVFKRFAKRINLEEANYLTASLTILNKTGGDIVKVFSSIEKSMFDKRTLRLELESLTSGSKIVVYILLSIPFVFALVISLISPTYFMPFITTELGHILLIFMIIYYIIFVVVVKKIMKVVI
jgi:tight adherence protein B